MSKAHRRRTSPRRTLSCAGRRRVCWRCSATPLRLLRPRLPTVVTDGFIGPAGAVSTRSATGEGVRLGRPGLGRQVLLEDLARGAVAEAAARRVVEPVGEPAEVGSRERLGRALAR